MQPKLLRASRDFKKRHPFRTKFIQYFIYTALPLLLMVTIGVYLFFQFKYETHLNSVVHHETHLLELKQREIRGMSRTLFSDIDLLGAYYMSISGQDGWQETLRTLFYRYMRYKPFYRQIRMIDSSGMELVRATARYIDKGIEEMTQSKRRRRYVQQGLLLKPDGYLLSRFNLNVEREMIEKPINPVVRLIKPLFRGEQRLGMIVINLSGRDLLMILGRARGAEYNYLVDHTGGLIIAPGGKGVWDFLLNPDDPELFQSDHKEVWERMVVEKKGRIVQEDGVFIFNTIDKNVFSDRKGLILDGPFLKQIVHLPEAVLKRPVYQIFWWILGGFLGASIVIAFLITLFRIQKLIALDQLKTVDQIDPLTKLLNRRAFLEVFDAERVRGRHLNQPFGVIMGDIDRFREVNDDFGPAAGDQMIRSVGIAIKSVLRKGDVVCRWEGASFMMLLPGITDKEGTKVVDKIRSKVEKVRINYQKKQINVTISFGVVICGKNGEWDDVQCLKKVTSVLKDAKDGGRNRVEMG